MADSFQIIDADAHVIETERTWDYLDESDRKYQPRLYSTPNDSMRQYWVLEDKIAGFRFLTLSERELQDFAERAGRNFPRRKRRENWTMSSCVSNTWTSWASTFRCCTTPSGSNK